MPLLYDNFRVCKDVNKDIYLVFSKIENYSHSVLIYNLTAKKKVYTAIVDTYGTFDNSILTSGYFAVDIQGSMLYFWKYVCHEFESTSYFSGSCVSSNYYLYQLDFSNNSRKLIGSITVDPSVTTISPDGKIVAFIKSVKSVTTSGWRKGWVTLSTLNI